MVESLIQVKVVNSDSKKDRCGLKLDYSWNKYISKITATKVKAMTEKIYERLPEELIFFHYAEDKPMFHIKEESTGIYVESPYIDLIKDMPEYKDLFDSVIFSLKRDYAAFCINRTTKEREGRAS